MNIGAITQEGQTTAVYKEIEDADRVKQIDDVQEFNALTNAEVMINQGGFFDLYV